MVKILYNRLLGHWYVVRGADSTPLSGAFETRDQAQAWLNSRSA